MYYIDKFVKLLKSFSVLGNFFFAEAEILLLHKQEKSLVVFPWTGRRFVLPYDRWAVPPLQLGVVQGLPVAAEGGVAGGAEEAGHGAPQG